MVNLALKEVKATQVQYYLHKYTKTKMREKKKMWHNLDTLIRRKEAKERCLFLLFATAVIEATLHTWACFNFPDICHVLLQIFGKLPKTESGGTLITPYFYGQLKN